MARLEGQGHTGLHDCPRPRSDARRRARRKTDRPHVTADPVGRGHCDPRSLMNAEQVQPNTPRERPLARFPGLSRNRKTILATCVELNSLDDVDLQLQRQTQHARVCNRRRLAADSSWQVGCDLIPSVSLSVRTVFALMTLKTVPSAERVMSSRGWKILLKPMSS